ncbi:MAG: hypothetical protein AB1567_02045 [bacterium]
MSKSFSHQLSPEEQDNELICAFEHLKRAAVEPLEFVVEERMSRIDKKRRFILFSKLLLVKTPSKKEINDKVEEIKTHVRSGRLQKGLSGNLQECLNHFKIAHKKVIELEETLSPAILNDRIFQVILLILGLIIGSILTKLIS